MAVMGLGKGWRLLGWWLMQPGETYVTFIGQNNFQKKHNHISQSLIPPVPPWHPVGVSAQHLLGAST